MSPVACAHKVLPNAKADFLDFSVFKTDGTWGASSGTGAGLTGGTSKYNGTDCTIAFDGAGGSLKITSSLVASGYSGLTFWFGPCIDLTTPTAYTGIQFSIAATTTGEVVTKLMIQTNADYPVDTANKKGACLWTDESTKWSTCASPSAKVTVTDVATVIKVPFADITGGSPTAGVDVNELVGFQLQFECNSADPCTLDATLDDVAFYQ